VFLALAALLAVGVAGSAGAATLDFVGTLRLKFGSYANEPIPFTIPGSGSAQATDDGSLHLLSFLLPGGAFGPASMSLPTTSSGTMGSFRITGAMNLTGSFGGISGGPPGGGPMGLSGLAKVCILPESMGCPGFFPVPLSPTGGGAGFGIGGTVTTTTNTGGVIVTMQNAPWTMGQPAMTLHTANSTFSTPVLPGGFAHGPASLTSSTAQPSGALQLVTVTKIYTNFYQAFPEFPLIGVLSLHFVPEPGTLVLLATGVTVFSLYGRGKRRR
jgi:hypothetical protein